MTLTINTVSEFKDAIKDMTKQGRDRVAAAIAKDESAGALTKALKKVWHTNKFGDLYKPIAAMFTALCKEIDDADVGFECGETALKHNYKRLSLIMPINAEGDDTELVLVLEKCANEQGNAVRTLKVNGKAGKAVNPDGRWRYATVSEEAAFLADVNTDKLEDIIDAE
jgi:hypothetical protein